MVDISEKYATEHKIKFSTDPLPKKSKTKGIIFSEKPLNFSPSPIYLSGNALPWVQEANYLGGRLTSTLDGYQQDARMKRAQFIEKNCELSQEFYMAHPDIICKVNRIYNSSFSGSVLWDMEGKHTSQLINSWSVAVRHMWDIPLNSHRWCIESFGGTHAQVMLVTRYINFIQSLQKSSRRAVLLLFQKCKNNLLTVTGRNVDFVQKQLNHSDICSMKINDVKKRYKFSEVSREDSWKVSFVKEITNIKQNILHLEASDNQFSIEELNEIINFIVTS